MRDPGLVELELALTWRCDTLLDSKATLDRDQVLVAVYWRYRGREFRARLVVPPGRRISLHQWLLWRWRGRQFRLLPSQPCFECYGPHGWQQVDTVAQWRGVFSTPSGDAPGAPPGELSGHPVRPRPGFPALDASAAATPEALPWEREVLPVRLLHS